jgi:hypothetical protein
MLGIRSAFAPEREGRLKGHYYDIKAGLAALVGPSERLPPDFGVKTIRAEAMSNPRFCPRPPNSLHFAARRFT